LPISSSSLVSWNTGGWTKARNPVILNVVNHRQNPLQPIHLPSSVMLSTDSRVAEWSII
jgi:hypothetical protein